MASVRRAIEHPVRIPARGSRSRAFRKRDDVGMCRRKADQMLEDQDLDDAERSCVMLMM